MRNFLIVLFLGITFGSWSQQPLIGIKNGDWIIINGSQQQQLPAHYYDVGNFDQQGIAYFATDGKYGIIDAEGNELLTAQFERIESFGWGAFGGISDAGNVIIHCKGTDIKIDSCRTWDKLDDRWTIMYRKNDNRLINFSADKIIRIDSSITLEENLFGYVSVAQNDFVNIYDPNGRKVDLTGGSASFQSSYIRLKSSKMDRLILSNQTFDLPNDVKRFNFDGTYFQYSTDNRTVRMDVFGNNHLDVPYADVKNAGFDRLIFRDNTKSGVMDGKGNVIIPAVYLFLSASRNGYHATTDKGEGLLSKSGSIIVPCRYESVYKQADFYVVESQSGLYGVYSSKRKKEILSPRFQKITVSKDRIRGWLRETLQIAYYNEDHSIEKTITLNNTVSRFLHAQESWGYDARLLNVGWFFEEKTLFDEEGFATGADRRWGVKDAGDSILAKARFPNPVYIPTANFSLIHVGAQEREFMGRKLPKNNVFSAMDLTTGRIMPGDFLQIDTTDALSKDFIRYSSTEGFGYFTRDNKMHPVLHFDRENDTYLRFTTSETGSYNVVEKEERESVRLSTYVLNNPEDPKYQTWYFRNKNYEYVTLPEAKWNFLHPNGTLLFQESFEYADRFFLNTAIIKREGNWGVANTDSLFIPAEYSQVERMKEFNDTVFLVRKNRNGNRFLDRNSNEVPLQLTKVVKVKKEYSIVESRGKQLVLNNAHEVISDDSERYRALNERYFHSRRDRKSFIYDSDGELLAEIGAKSKDVFFDQLIVFRDGTRYGIMDDRGDTLLPNEYKSIEIFGDLILAEGKDTRVFNQKGEEVFRFDTEKVLIDSVTNRLAVNKSGKITIYEMDGTKVAKLKNIDPDLFINNVLFDLGSSGVSMHVSNEEFDLVNGIKSIVSAGNTGYILETKKGFRVVDQNWKSYSEVGDFDYRKCRYLGEGVVFLKPENTLFSKQYGKHGFNGNIVKGFNAGLLLTYLPSDRKYRYITPEGKDPFEQKFKDAKPFQDGYASVQMRRGWAIIDANGRPKSLDSYSEIEVYGNGLFSSQSASLYGMIDHHGTVILEANFERLEILNESVIQAVKNGDILYFELDGTPIEY